MTELDENTPLFVISVAAELALMHPQTLRQYDRLGLVSPSRTAGQSRRYTMRNVAQLREIARLSTEGVSLEGIKRILELENQNIELKKRVRDLEQALSIKADDKSCMIALRKLYLLTGNEANAKIMSDKLKGGK
jgi:MerR family transcriptional regulator/heat shock protein HspR